MAGVAQTHIHRRFAWQAWHSWHWVARLDWLGRPVTPRHFAWQAWHKLTPTCRFTWQAWHKLTSTVVLRGRRGTHGTGWRAWTGLGARDAAALCVAGVAQPDIPPSFHVAGVAQTHIHCRFAWQAWHSWYWVARSLSHPTFHTPSFTHHIVTHHLSHTIFHTPLCHIPSLTHRFVTHHFVTPHLSYTIFHTSHCHTPSFTHHFVTYHL